jgi:branched-chain amino acid transport system substrate-binding protein
MMNARKTEERAMTARVMRCVLAALLGAMVIAAPRARADTAAQKIAVQTSLTGVSSLAGNAFLDAIRFAVDEANSAASGVRFELEVFDDASTEEGSRQAASLVAASDAAIVLGPARTPLAVSACRTYGDVGLPIIATTLHADALTENPTTFRTVISTGEIGETLADYLGRVLRSRRAVVFSIDNDYGRPLAERFKDSAARQGMDVAFRSFTSTADRDSIARELGAARDDAPIVLGMEYEDAVPVLKTLRRQGYRGLVMGTATMARASFAALFAGEPEEQATPGFFTENTYAASPMILDSANAEILAFAGRYLARYGREPSWEAVQAYDGAVLAMAALRRALAERPKLMNLDLRARRQAALAAIERFDGPTRAVLGLNGPIWFTPDRIRRQPVRIGRFHEGVFESAPLQLLPVADPDQRELASGAVFQTEPGHYYRLQRVVQTGTYLNLIPRVDVAKSSFGADFYLWLRFAGDAGPDASDPVDISFPGMLSGRFDPNAPAEATVMADGAQYRLWRVQGEFRSDFDLHRFPFDRQTLQLRFFNARASSDHIIYVLDRRSRTNNLPAAPISPNSGGSGAASAAPLAAVTDVQSSQSLVSRRAFDDLTQWKPAGAHERRDTLVTPSSLGDLRRIGLETPRELSGFVVSFDLERRTSAVLIKMLFPMLLMTVVMYTTLHFPVALTKEKVTVAVTAALSGAVLLSSVNNQLGSVGYTIAVEYAFYSFFALGLLCILYVTAFEALRLDGREVAAGRIEHATRVVFIGAVVVIIVLAGITYTISR